MNKIRWIDLKRLKDIDTHIFIHFGCHIEYGHRITLFSFQFQVKKNIYWKLFIGRKNSALIRSHSLSFMCNMYPTGRADLQHLMLLNPQITYQSVFVVY